MEFKESKVNCFYFIESSTVKFVNGNGVLKSSVAISEFLPAIVTVPITKDLYKLPKYGLDPISLLSFQALSKLFFTVNVYIIRYNP